MNHETHEKQEKIIFKEACYATQGAIFEVYRILGCGFFEAAYQEALDLEFEKQNVPFMAQCQLDFIYKGIALKQSYKPDFICYGKIIRKLKAVQEFSLEHEAQIMNYLKITGLRMGVLANFDHYPKVETKRMVI